MKNLIYRSDGDYAGEHSSFTGKVRGSRPYDRTRSAERRRRDEERRRRREQKHFYC